jgi:hypothetical protein
MKIVCSEPQHVGSAPSLAAAFDAAIALDALVFVHGPRVTVDDWKTSKQDLLERHYRVVNQLPETLPPALRSLAGGEHVEMTVRQRVAIGKQKADRVEIENKLKLHVPCNKLIKIKYTFEIDRDAATAHVAVATRIKVRVLLPPPLNAIAEEYILDMFRESIASFATAMRRSL